MNNLEFDHADIFENLDAIKKQFHHLVRSVPSNGLILSPAADPNLDSVLEMGCWSEQQFIGNAQKSDWKAKLLKSDGSKFLLYYKGEIAGEITWPLIGEHNVNNAMMAIAAAHHAGVSIKDAIEALSSFKNVKRRMEVKGTIGGVTVYDDFAHHPTAIETTVTGLRNKVGNQKIIAVLEPRSNTMKMGVHKSQLAQSWQGADHVILFEPPGLDWSLKELVANSKIDVDLYQNVEEIVTQVTHFANAGDHVLVMSNGGFEGIHNRILNALGEKFAE
jgi:UDP-N-acetylmuramate: L-alanyl-gamma-D-glutamyl-meso-diaminopimelate ligase